VKDSLLGFAEALETEDDLVAGQGQDDEDQVGKQLPDDLGRGARCLPLPVVVGQGLV